MLHPLRRLSIESDYCESRLLYEPKSGIGCECSDSLTLNMTSCQHSGPVSMIYDAPSSGDWRDVAPASGHNNTCTLNAIIIGNLAEGAEQKTPTTHPHRLMDYTVPWHIRTFMDIVVVVLEPTQGITTGVLWTALVITRRASPSFAGTLNRKQSCRSAGGSILRWMAQLQPFLLLHLHLLLLLLPRLLPLFLFYFLFSIFCLFPPPPLTPTPLSVSSVRRLNFLRW